MMLYEIQGIVKHDRARLETLGRLLPGFDLHQEVTSWPLAERATLATPAESSNAAKQTPSPMSPHCPMPSAAINYLLPMLASSLRPKTI